MKKEGAVAVTLKLLAKNGDEAKRKYAWASHSIDPELQYGASPQWFYDRMREYREAEYALREGDVQPAVALLNSLIRGGRRLGLTEDDFRRGKLSIVCLRDGLLGIDTPPLPSLPPKLPPKRTLGDRLFDSLLDRLSR